MKSASTPPSFKSAPPGKVVEAIASASHAPSLQLFNGGGVGQMPPRFASRKINDRISRNVKLVCDFTAIPSRKVQLPNLANALLGKGGVLDLLSSRHLARVSPFVIQWRGRASLAANRISDIILLTPPSKMIGIATTRLVAGMKGEGLIRRWLAMPLGACHSMREILHPVDHKGPIASTRFTRHPVPTLVNLPFGDFAPKLCADFPIHSLTLSGSGRKSIGGSYQNS